MWDAVALVVDLEPNAVHICLSVVLQFINETMHTVVCTLKVLMHMHKRCMGGSSSNTAVCAGMPGIMDWLLAAAMKQTITCTYCRILIESNMLFMLLTVIILRSRQLPLLLLCC